jgi:hypothetical protein
MMRRLCGKKYPLWEDKIDSPVVRLIMLPAHKKLSRVDYVVQREQSHKAMVRDSKSNFL